MGPKRVHVPILSHILSEGFQFCYGESYLVKFGSSTPWFQLSLNIAAEALKAGQLTQYHTFGHQPQKAREGLVALGVDTQKMSLFRPIDDFIKLSGLPIQPLLGNSAGKWNIPSPALNDPTSYVNNQIEPTRKLLGEGAMEEDKKWLHIDDDTSTYFRY